MSGPFQCPEGATADIDVTLTQLGTGAVARGHVRARCEAGETTFTLDVETTGNTAFLPLTEAQACGTARIHAANISIDSFQWCRQITLLPEGAELEE